MKYPMTYEKRVVLSYSSQTMTPFYCEEWCMVTIVNGLQESGCSLRVDILCSSWAGPLVGLT